MAQSLADKGLMHFCCFIQGVHECARRQQCHHCQSEIKRRTRNISLCFGHSWTVNKKMCIPDNTGTHTAFFVLSSFTAPACTIYGLESTCTYMPANSAFSGPMNAWLIYCQYCVFWRSFYMLMGRGGKAYAFKFCTYIGGFQVAVKELMICMNT